MTTIYAYNTDLGTFEIKLSQHGRYELWFEEEKLGDYESAEAAAADVATFNSGNLEWDDMENELANPPTTLGSWNRVEEEKPV